MLVPGSVGEGATAQREQGTESKGLGTVRSCSCLAFSLLLLVLAVAASSRRGKDASADAGGAVVVGGGSIQHSSRQATAMRPKQKESESKRASRAAEFHFLQQTKHERQADPALLSPVRCLFFLATG